MVKDEESYVSLGTFTFTYFDGNVINKCTKTNFDI